jgi:hypothetical protein
LFPPKIRINEPKQSDTVIHPSPKSGCLTIANPRAEMLELATRIMAPTSPLNWRKSQYREPLAGGGKDARTFVLIVY